MPKTPKSPRKSAGPTKSPTSRSRRKSESNTTSSRRRNPAETSAPGSSTDHKNQAEIQSNVCLRLQSIFVALILVEQVDTSQIGNTEANGTEEEVPGAAAKGKGSSKASPKRPVGRKSSFGRPRPSYEEDDWGFLEQGTFDGMSNDDAAALCMPSIVSGKRLLKCFS
ncbi:hypothetical protein H0H93_010670 [Arthromyces matolae]|nr:hypothetical protein H0H93_010670 [Arthromyces matolae]